jgi:hypothetical protein
MAQDATCKNSIRSGGPEHYLGAAAEQRTNYTYRTVMNSGMRSGSLCPRRSLSV